MSGYGGYEYDTANADTGGGGFMSQGDNPSSQGDKKEKKPRDKQSLVPLTVKQLLGATKAGADDEGFHVDGRELSQVRIVGSVLSEDSRETKATYVVEDGTGAIEVTLWLNDAADEESVLRQRIAKTRPGTYVVVHGQPKEYSGKMLVSAYDMKPVEDFNQVTHHYLEAIYVHAKATNKIAAPEKAAARGSMEGFLPKAAGQSAAGGADGADGVTSLQQRVLDYYTEHGTSDEGCATANVASGLGIDLAMVKSAVDSLSSEGFLYSTIDDDHHKSTAAE